MINLSNTRIAEFDKAVQMRAESTNAFVDIWKEYSILSTFEYWIMVAILVLPLIVLFFKIDKSKIFFIGFYGYSAHVITAYADLWGMNKGYWHYPFQVIPTLPSLSVDASLIPVVFMLIYQWTLNHKKNFYLYSSIGAGVVSFAFKPLLVALGLFKLYGKMTYFHLFAAYFLGIFVAKFITDVFLWTEKRYNRKKSSG